MIAAKENKVYLKYANVLFDYFRGANCSAGQGGFLMRTMRTKYDNSEQRVLLNYLYMILLSENELVKTQEIYQGIKDKPNNNLTLICVDATPRPSASQI